MRALGEVRTPDPAFGGQATIHLSRAWCARSRPARDHGACGEFCWASGAPDRIRTCDSRDRNPGGDPARHGRVAPGAGIEPASSRLTGERLSRSATLEWKAVWLARSMGGPPLRRDPYPMARGFIATATPLASGVTSSPPSESDRLLPGTGRARRQQRLTGGSRGANRTRFLRVMSPTRSEPHRGEVLHFSTLQHRSYHGARARNRTGSCALRKRRSSI